MVSGLTVKFNLLDDSVEYEHLGGGKDNLLVTDSGLWVAAHNYSGIEGLQCDESIVQCPLPFTIHQLSLSDLSEIQKLSNFPNKPLKLQSVFKYSTFSAAKEYEFEAIIMVIIENNLNKFFTLFYFTFFISGGS